MQIEHIAMYVKDLEAARIFFEKYFAATASNMYHNSITGFKSYFLSFVGGARLEIMNRPELQDDDKATNRTGYIHIAFSVGSKEKVDLLTSRLKDGGYEIFSNPRTTGDGYYESCVVGFEDNLIEITI